MEKEILTMEEAADLFGVSVKTFIKLLKEEKVPARKIGREWRFSRKALIDWLSVGDSQSYSSSEGETKEFFNQVASEWEKISMDAYGESVKDRLLALKLLKKGMTAADLGAGDGYISRAIAKQIKSVVAVDISGEMLKELSKKAADSGIKNITPLEGDGLDIPTGDESVDLVCASMYLHHIEQPETAISEMERILKPGGTVFLADFEEYIDNEFKQKMHDLWPGFKIGQLEEWFRVKGFENIMVDVIKEPGKSAANGRESKKNIFVLTANKLG